MLALFLVGASRKVENPVAEFRKCFGKAAIKLRPFLAIFAVGFVLGRILDIVAPEWAALFSGLLFTLVGI